MDQCTSAGLVFRIRRNVVSVLGKLRSNKPLMVMGNTVQFSPSLEVLISGVRAYSSSSSPGRSDRPLIAAGSANSITSADSPDCVFSLRQIVLKLLSMISGISGVVRRTEGSILSARL